MLTEQQRLAVEAATRILKLGGIDAWFEARIIQDSDKKLNGRRVSSKRRTDLDRVLKVADEKRVGLLPDMRMELRMYATVTSSRSVVMGEEQTPPGDALMAGALGRVASRIYGVDPGRPGGDHTAVAVIQDGKVITIGGPEMLEGRANFSPRKNVERLIAEGAPAQLVEKARGRFPGMPANPDAPLAGARTVAQHTCDAAGPMRQREPGGPFVTTCSLCGEINGTTAPT